MYKTFSEIKIRFVDKWDASQIVSEYLVTNTTVYTLSLILRGSFKTTTLTVRVIVVPVKITLFILLCRDSHICVLNRASYNPYVMPRAQTYANKFTSKAFSCNVKLQLPCFHMSTQSQTIPANLKKGHETGI